LTDKIQNQSVREHTLQLAENVVDGNVVKVASTQSETVPVSVCNHNNIHGKIGDYFTVKGRYFTRAMLYTSGA
jgi:hypothetical protein